MKYDVIVLGSGFAGSISATLLAKYGYRVLLLEKSSHPRFALGESATLITARIFQYMTDFYDIPEYKPLTDYAGSVGVKLQCGPKEYFHFYRHKLGEEDSRIEGRHPELASQIPFVVNQYFREDLDQRLVEIAMKYGVEYVDQTNVERIVFEDDGVKLRIRREGESAKELAAEFVIDGTGHNSLLTRELNLRDNISESDIPLKSRSIFTHFRGVQRFEEMFNEGAQFNPNLKIDRRLATQHHCFEGGWYWFIPFDNGITSVGVSLDMDLYPINDMDAETEFWEVTRKLPLVQRMLANAKPVMPFVKTKRLQFFNHQITGDRWLQLPAAAMGLDAWQSSGLAVSLMAIHRIVELLHQRVLPKRDFRRDVLMGYENALREEYNALSKLVHGMYKSFKHFDVFALYSMVPFIGTFGFLNNKEYKRPFDEKALVMHFGDKQFAGDFEKIYQKVVSLSALPTAPAQEVEYIRGIMLDDMRANNPRRYGDPQSGGVYCNVVNELRDQPAVAAM